MPGCVEETRLSYSAPRPPAHSTAAYHLYGPDRPIAPVVRLHRGPAHSPGRDAYMHEAIYERDIPGEGELPLVDFVKALPPGRVIAVEVPKRSLEEQGVAPEVRARRYFEATKAVIDAAAA